MKYLLEKGRKGYLQRRNKTTRTTHHYGVKHSVLAVTHEVLAGEGEEGISGLHVLAENQQDSKDKHCVITVYNVCHLL